MKVDFSLKAKTVTEVSLYVKSHTKYSKSWLCDYLYFTKM